MGSTVRKQASERGSSRSRATNLEQRPGRQAPATSAHWWWFAICLNAVVFYPGLWSATVWPKFLWVAVTVAAGWLLARRNRATRLSLTPLGLVWILYLLWALLSLTWAPAPWIGLERWSILLLWTLAYLVALRTRFWEKPRFWTAFQWLFAVVCAAGCAQFVLARRFFGEEFRQIVTNAIPHSGLPSAMMGHRNYAAIYLAVIVPFVAWQLYRTRGRARALPAVALTLGVAFLIFTRSRQAWIAVALSVPFMLMFGGIAKIRASAAHRRLTLCLMGAAALLLIATAVLRAPSAVLESGWRAMPAEKESVIDTITEPFRKKGTDPRLSMWKPALRLMSPSQYPSRLVHGFGFGNFAIASSRYVDQVRTLDYEIHNDYLQALLELGIPGMTLFCAFFLFLLSLAIRQKSSGVAIAAGGAVVALAAIQSLTFTSENVSPLAWMAGVAAILNADTKTRPIGQWANSPRAVMIVRGCAATFLISMVLLIASALWAERQMFAEVNSGPNADYERLAHKVLPWMHFNSNVAFTQSHQLAGRLLRERRVDLAEIFARKAVALHPNDWGSYEVLSIAAQSKGNMSKAIEYQRLAAELGANARSPQFLLRLRDLCVAEGDLEEATAAMAKAVSKLLTMPTNPKPQSGSLNVPLDITLSWDPIPSATKYDVYFWRQQDPIPPEPTAHFITTNNYKPPQPLEPGTGYYWTVKAFSPDARIQSNRWQFRTVDKKK